MKFFDLKRLLLGRTALIFALAAPIVLVLLIALMVAPYFYADVRTQDFTVAVFNEDDDALTQTILSGLVESQSLGGLISTEFVYSDEQGRRAVEQGAAAYIHIPKGMQDAVNVGEPMVISYYGNPKMPLEDALLFETLSAGLELVSHATHGVGVLFRTSLEHGIDRETARDAAYMRMRSDFFLKVLARSALYADTEEASPLGGALPLEYYAASLLVLFVALGSLPIAHITAEDSAKGLLHRQLLSGRSPSSCFLSRWLAGIVFLFIQYAALSLALGAITGTAQSGSVVVLLLGGLLLCAFISLGAVCVGLFTKASAAAVRVVFLMALALALLGGLLLPSAYMPTIVRDISFYTPFSAALKLCIAGLFNQNAQGLFVYAAIIGACTAVLLPLCIKRFQRRAR